MTKIGPDEVEIVGHWRVMDGAVRGDANCERIRALTAGHLEKLATSPESGGWDTLFIDRSDGRLWEMYYPNSELHGGGPESLRVISSSQAKDKYQLPHSN